MLALPVCFLLMAADKFTIKYSKREWWVHDTRALARSKVQYLTSDASNTSLGIFSLIFSPEFQLLLLPACAGQIRPHMLKRHPSHVNQCPRRSPDRLADYGCKWQPCNCTYLWLADRERAAVSVPLRSSARPHFPHPPRRYCSPPATVLPPWMPTWIVTGTRMFYTSSAAMTNTRKFRDVTYGHH